jgi:anti-anti-sigma factor
MKLQHSSRGDPMIVVVGPCSERFCAVHIDGPLLAPVNQELATRVRVLLQRGERHIVLDLSSVSRIDAAGVGELVRSYNTACAMNVSLRIVHTTERVRETLGRVGLFDLLSADDDAECPGMN